MEEQAKTKETQATEKTEAKCACSPKGLVKIVLGVVLIILGLWAVIGWWQSLLMVIRGGIGLLLLLAGAITIAIAKE